MAYCTNNVLYSLIILHCSAHIVECNMRQSGSYDRLIINQVCYETKCEEQSVSDTQINDLVFKIDCENEMMQSESIYVCFRP